MLVMNRSVPIVWRTETCVQLGVDDPVLIDGICAADTQLIELIRAGIDEDDLFARAAELGSSFKRTSALVSLLTEANVLVPESSLTADVTQETDSLAHSCGASPHHFSSLLSQREVLAAGPLRTDIAAFAQASGFPTRLLDDIDPYQIPIDSHVVLTSIWGPDLYSASILMNAGVTHTLLDFGQHAATVSQTVDPGRTPCTGCWAGELSDADDGWLMGWNAMRSRSPSPARVDPVLLSLGCLHAVNAVRMFTLDILSEPQRVRVTLPLGEVIRTPVLPHPRCDCLSNPLYATDLDAGEGILRGTSV